MTSPFSRSPAPALAAVLLAATLGLSACVAPAAPHPSASPADSSDTQGIDAGGAAEIASPALALIVADEDGVLTLVDLETEERATLGEPHDHPRGVVGDGRRVYLAHGAGARTSVEIVDSGRWTVPHGDHSHSFRADPRVLGSVEGEGQVDVRPGDLRTALHFEGGGALVLDHEDLGEEVFATPDPVSLETDASLHGPLLPFASHLLAATDAATIEIRDSGGERTSTEAVPCARATDADVTRVGAVFACASGAVLFTREVGGAIATETIPYPADATPATGLSGRPDRPDLAGVAGAEGAWLLDVRQRRWALLPSEVPLLRATALGDDDSRTVAIDEDGRVRVLAPDGTVLVRTDPLLADSLADPRLRDRVQLLVDARHAYVTDPVNGAVHEIDHRDGRVTRTFADLDPWFVQQVG